MYVFPVLSHLLLTMEMLAYEEDLRKELSTSEYIVCISRFELAKLCKFDIRHQPRYRLSVNKSIR